MSGFPADNTAFALALMPTERYAVRRAQKDQELLYQQALAQQAAADNQQMQQQVAMMQQTEQAILAQPFLGKDKVALNQWWNGKKKELAAKIENDYKGDAKRFLSSEGRSTVQDLSNEFLGSELYTRGSNNTKNFLLAQEALKKGEYVIGEYGANGKYQSGIQSMADFINGKSDSFSFRGSYKEVPTAKMIDHFSKMDNPYNKFDRSATVPRREIEAWIRANSTPEVANDLIARGYADVPISYKRYSIQDEMNFNSDEALKAQRLNLMQSQIGLNAQRSVLNQQKIAENAQNAADSQGSGGGAAWFTKYKGTPLAPVQEVFKPNKNEDYSISTLGTTLADYSQDGQLKFTERNVLTDTGKSYVRNKAGIGDKGGTVSEAILTKNGGHVLKLGQVPHVVESVDGNIYLPTADIQSVPNGIEQRKRGDGFTKATLRVPKSAADALGLYNDNWWIFPNTDTDKGRGIYTEDKKTGDLIFKDVLIPLPGIYYDQEFNRLMLKNSMGQKAANEYSDTGSGVTMDELAY